VALNLNHLRYFWAIAHEGSMTRAAERLHVSPSALSIQLRKLEDQLGQALFRREGRGLQLTEAGRIALDYADTVMETGNELVSTLAGHREAPRPVLRVGAITTLSRNFQLAWLAPVLGRADVQLSLRSGTMRELLAELEAHALDVVLANRPAARDARTPWRNHLLREEPVSLVGRSDTVDQALDFPDGLAGVPLVVPSLDSDIRVAFDHMLELAGVRPTLLAEVDDMAMLRLMARENPGATLVPPVVVRGELASGLLCERCRLPELTERFYAITLGRRYPNPLVAELLADGGHPDPA
jgi:LysR family transcriptional activator of nhaA